MSVRNMRIKIIRLNSNRKQNSASGYKSISQTIQKILFQCSTRVFYSKIIFRWKYLLVNLVNIKNTFIFASRNRGIVQSGQYAWFGSKRSQVRILLPRLTKRNKVLKFCSFFVFNRMGMKKNERHLWVSLVFLSFLFLAFICFEIQLEFQQEQNQLLVP